jgi:hypothetical protein
MASQILATYIPDGDNVVFDAYPLTSATPLFTDLAGIQAGGGTGYYQANYAGTETGFYRLVVRSDDPEIQGLWYINLTNRAGSVVDVAGDNGPRDQELVEEFADIKGSGWSSNNSLRNISDTLSLNFDTLHDVVNPSRAVIGAVLSQVQFEAAITSPTFNDNVVGSTVIIYNAGAVDSYATREVIAYDELNFRYTINAAPPFTLTTDDTFSLYRQNVKLSQIVSKLPAGTLPDTDTFMNINMEQTVPTTPINNTTGQVYKLIRDNLNAPVDTIDSNVDAIKLQTDKLLFDAGNRIMSNLQAILGGVLTELTSGRVGANFTTFYENADLNSNVLLSDITTVTSPGGATRGITDGARTMEISTSNVQYVFNLSVYDINGVSSNADSLPTVEASNNVGTDVSARLGTVALRPGKTGVYEVTFEVQPADPPNTEITLFWQHVEGGDTINTSFSTYVVDQAGINVNLNMGQTLPVAPVIGTVGSSFSKSEQLAFTSGRVNSRVDSFADVEWKRVLETVTLAEAYGVLAGDGTLSQLLYELVAILENPKYVGTLLQARERDGTTVAMEFTMDDATNPTEHNRTT